VSAETHVIRWEFDDGYVTPTAICLADEGADCRLTSVSCECERWGEIRRDEIGTPWHKIVDWYGNSIDSAEPQWHELKPLGDCNVCLFINESGCVDELAVKGARFTIGEVPIRPVWIDEGCDWEPVTDA
jgi:hypothetical protein